MKIKINKTEWERKVTTTEIEIKPEQKYFFFSRRAYSVKPKLNGEQYEDCLDIVSVDCEENIIKSKKIKLYDIGRSLDNDNSNKWYYEILEHYINHSNYDIRTKERFESDFNNVINNITNNK